MDASHAKKSWCTFDPCGQLVLAMKLKHCIMESCYNLNINLKLNN